MNTSAARTLILASALAVGGCATLAPAEPASLQLPLQIAWFEGRVVHYVTTDSSDAAVAQAKGANFVPRLKQLLPETAGGAQRGGAQLERVYSFVNTRQPTVFPSIPRPVGPASRDASYTPLWRMVRVEWLPGRMEVEVKSEEQLLAAQERGDLKLTLTDVVLNCPVVGIVGEPYLRGVRLAQP